MPDPKQRQDTPDTESVDWAERLKASLNIETVDEVSTEPIPDEEDDLKGLLLAQLARHREAAEYADSLDTSEFEDEFDEDDDDFDDEDLDDEEEDEPFDDDDALNAEDLPDAIREAIPAVPLTESAVDHDVPGVSRRVIGADWAPPDEQPTYASERDRKTDDYVNGRALHTETDDPAACRNENRRRVLQEENARMLDEIEQNRTAAVDSYTDTVSIVTDESVADAPSVNEEAEDTEKVISRRRPSVISYDPLQLGHEDTTRPATENPPPRGVSDILDGEIPIEIPKRASATYTESMTGTTPVEVQKQTAALRDDLGYNAELRRPAERRAVEHARTEHARAGWNTDSTNRTTRSAARETENTADDVRARHRRDREMRLLRWVIASVGALLALVWDLLPQILARTGHAPKPVSGPLYPLISLCLMVVVAAPFASRLGKGIVGLLRFTPTRYSAAVSALTVNLLYLAVAAIAMSRSGITLSLFTGLTLVLLSIIALSEHLDAEGEWEAWDIASSCRAVYALTDEETPAATALNGGYSRRRAPLTAVRTVTNDRIFTRSEPYDSHMNRLNYLLPAALGAAIICGGASLLAGGELLADAARIFVAVFLAALPTAYLVAMGWPLFRANRQLGRHGCAVFGTAVPDAYLGRKDAKRQICFSDGEVIIATRRKEITLRSGTDEDPQAPSADRWRRLSNRLFHLLHSPLAVELPLEDDGSSDALKYMHIEIAEQDTHYIRLFLINETPGEEETVEVMMGSHEALSRRGIRLPRRSMEESYRKSENSHVVYLAFDGNFRIGFATEYRVRREFQTVPEALTTCHATPVMTTYDPMLTSEMLASPRFDAIRHVKVVRPDYVDIPRRHVFSGVVAIDGEMALIHPLLACRRMETSCRLALALTWLGILLTIALALIAVVTGKGAYINPLSTLLLQLLLSLGAALVPLPVIRRKALFPTRKKSKKDK